MVNVVHTSRPNAKRQQKKQETTESIVDVALRQLEEAGADGVTMHTVAAECGYAVGALYRYFPSKDALLLAVQRRILEQLAEDIADAVARAEDHSKRAHLDDKARTLLRVAAAYSVYASLPQRAPVHFGVLARWLGEPKLVVDTAVALPHVPAFVALFLPVQQLLNEAAAAGALTSASGLNGVVMWGALQGVLQLGKLARFTPTFQLEPLVDELLGTLLRGQGAPADLVANVLGRVKKLQKEKS